MTGKELNVLYFQQDQAFGGWGSGLQSNEWNNWGVRGCRATGRRLNCVLSHNQVLRRRQSHGIPGAAARGCTVTSRGLKVFKCQQNQAFRRRQSRGVTGAARGRRAGESV